MLDKAQIRINAEMHQEAGNKQTFEQVLHDSDAYLSAQIAELQELLKLCLDRVARLEEEN